jgi:dTDP-4-dehydrorhamnose 3,5-epimerase
MEDKNVKKLKKFEDERGYLFETLRSDDSLFEGKFGQALVSLSKPGQIRAWHRHKNQTDYTVCVKGNIKLCTAEEKENGKVEIKEYLMGKDNMILVKVPAGVWHGYTPIGEKEVLVFYIMDQTYDSKNPDEERKEWDAFGKECWGK